MCVLRSVLALRTRSCHHRLAPPLHLRSFDSAFCSINYIGLKKKYLTAPPAKPYFYTKTANFTPSSTYIHRLHRICTGSTCLLHQVTLEWGWWWWGWGYRSVPPPNIRIYADDFSSSIYLFSYKYLTKQRNTRVLTYSRVLTSTHECSRVLTKYSRVRVSHSLSCSFH